MGRSIHRLSDREVINKRKPGLYADGGGLYLQVAPSSKGITRSWLYRFTLDRKARKMGLGSCNVVSLAEAREAAKECRKRLHAGDDPIVARNLERDAKRLERESARTFEQCAEAFIKTREASWKNEKHRLQWRQTLRDFAYPVIGRLPVQDVDVPAVMRVLEPIWEKKTETASRLRGRLEQILDWAAFMKYRAGDNPSRWSGNLKHGLANKGDIAPVVHHAAMAYSEIPNFMKRLRRLHGVSARALEFLILTACRSGEARGATRDEIENGVWKIPGERMKSKREHRVPLSNAALAVVRGQSERGLMFPGRRHAQLSDATLSGVLKRMGVKVTVHGFRSSFRDWGAERTNYPNEMLELALAHAVSDKVEAAYRRGDMLERRRRVMNDWADFCENGAGNTGTVTPIRAELA
jgi:integrase